VGINPSRPPQKGRRKASPRPSPKEREQCGGLSPTLSQGEGVAIVLLEPWMR